ncbi:hypothetical protein [Cribrihabitans pelagius]|uniref:hypothetical protein n=1 Tax=Cribrihabitans pelagius TaxID=1765746 RepID=UPI003B5AF756
MTATRPDARMLKTSPRARDLMSLVSQFLPGQGRPAAPAAAAAAAVTPQAVPGPDPAPVRTVARPAPVTALPAGTDAPVPIPPCAEPADPAADQAQDRGQFLARQERWEDLSGLIRAADTAREAARGALPLADLIAYGARADVVGAAEDALSVDAAFAGRGLIRGVMEFEALRAGHCRDPYLTALVALAHIDIAWAWRSSCAAGKRSSAAHFARAEQLLAPFADSALSLGSPFLQAAHCALLAGRPADPATAGRAEESYGRLIALDPRNPRAMRALGAQLLPGGGGSYAMLEQAARRTAAATDGAWGAGGYAWAYFDALALDPEACAHVDAELFLEGLRDILRTDASQDMVNLLAAYCTVALPAGAGKAGTAQRLRICGAAHWLVHGRLTELHPMVWALAAEGFGNSARVGALPRFASRGEAIARAALADLFRDGSADAEPGVSAPRDRAGAAG